MALLPIAPYQRLAAGVRPEAEGARDRSLGFNRSFALDSHGSCWQFTGCLQREQLTIKL